MLPYPSCYFETIAKEFERLAVQLRATPRPEAEAATRELETRAAAVRQDCPCGGRHAPHDHQD